LRRVLVRPFPLFPALPHHADPLRNSSEYQNLPLHSVEELRELAAQENPPPGLQVPLPAGDTEESAHELMLVRLAFELAERKRCALPRTSPLFRFLVLIFVLVTPFVQVRGGTEGTRRGQGEADQGERGQEGAVGGAGEAAERVHLGSSAPPRPFSLFVL
jgi:hypothetical protein